MMALKDRLAHPQTEKTAPIRPCHALNNSKSCRALINSSTATTTAAASTTAKKKMKR